MLKKTFWFLGVAAFVVFIFLPGYTKMQELREKNKDLIVKIKQLHIDNALLEQELKLIEIDPLYQEKIARERMGIVRKGEIPIKIVPADSKR